MPEHISLSRCTSHLQAAIRLIFCHPSPQLLFRSAPCLATLLCRKSIVWTYLNPPAEDDFIAASDTSWLTVSGQGEAAGQAAAQAAKAAEGNTGD